MGEGRGSPGPCPRQRQGVHVGAGGQSLTWRFECGSLPAWCEGWSSAQTPSPGKRMQGGKWKAAGTGAVRRAEEWGSALTWTATPKLFPSSIRGICSCNQVVTWEEGQASKPYQLPTEFPGSCPLLPCPRSGDVCQVCPKSQGLHFWLHLLCSLLLRPGRC